MLEDLDDYWLDALGRAQAHRWGHVEELLAMIAELLHAQLAAFVQVNSERPYRVDPLRIPRPSDAEIKPRRSTRAEIVRFFSKGGGG